LIFQEFIIYESEFIIGVSQSERNLFLFTNQNYVMMNDLKNLTLNEYWVGIIEVHLFYAWETQYKTG